MTVLKVLLKQKRQRQKEEKRRKNKITDIWGRGLSVRIYRDFWTEQKGWAWGGWWKSSIKNSQLFIDTKMSDLSKSYGKFKEDRANGEIDIGEKVNYGKIL